MLRHIQRAGKRAGGAEGWNPGLLGAPAWWRMLSGGLVTDSSGSGNTLTNVNAVTECTGLLDNVGCAQFVAASQNYFTITDADLSGNFPFKNGTDNKAITLCTWFNRQDYTAYDAIFAKYAGAGFFIVYFYGEKIRVGLDDGPTVEYRTHDTNIDGGKLYHLGVAYDADAQGLLIRMYNQTDGVPHGSDLIIAGAKAVVPGSGDVFIGARPSSNRWSSCKQGGISVVGSALPAPEIDAIREGTYGT